MDANDLNIDVININKYKSEIKIQWIASAINKIDPETMYIITDVTLNNVYNKFAEEIYE